MIPFEQFREFFDVKIIKALRRQDLWIESWYNQNIKWQWDKELRHVSFEQFLELLDKFHWINFEQYLSRPENSFGSDTILPIVFERDQMPNGPIETFMEKVGIDATNMNLPAPMNASLSAFTTELLRHFPLDELDSQHRKVLERIFVNLDTGIDKTPQESSKLLLSHEQRARIMDQFAPQNRAIAQKYFDREELFFAPLPDKSKIVVDFELPVGHEFMDRVMSPLIKSISNEIKKLQSNGNRH